MPENSATDILTNFLNDPAAVDTLAVARNRGNDIAQEGFGNDLLELSYGEIAQKYGADVANNRYKIQGGIERTADIGSAERSAAQIVGDSALSVGSGAVNTAGSLLSLGLAGIGSVDNENGENNTLNEAASGVLAGSQGVSNLLKSFQSDELYDRKQLSQIESELDKLDREAQYERDVETSGSFMATLAKVGSEALDTGGRILSDGAVAGDIISEALGSLGPSAKIAGAGARLATGATARVTSNQAVNKLAATAGAAAGVGVAEASGVYGQTVRAVESMSHEQLTEGSDEYVELIAGGLTADEARAKVALDTGKEAFARQLPTATALGLLTARFEAAPIGSFRGSGLLGGFRQIGAQALEEGAQGSTGAFNQNVAIQNQADRDQDLTEGLGEELATGVIAGAGMSGALAIPSTVAPSIGAAKDVADLVAPVVGPAVQKARDIGGAAVDKAVEVAAPVTKTVVEKVQDFNAATDPDISAEKVVSAIRARDTAVSIVQEAEAAGQGAIVDPSITQLVQPSQPKTVPAKFADAVSETGSPIENAAGLLQKFTDSNVNVNRLTEEEVVYAVSQFGALATVAKDLPEGVKEYVLNTLSSPDVQKVIKQFKEIDLNESQDVTSDVTPQNVQTTVEVAKAAPQNVNPEFVDKILEQDDLTEYTPQDIKNLEVGRDIARTINDQVGNYVEISKELNVELAKKPAYNGREDALPPVLDPSTTSRSLLLDGYTDKRNKKLKSVLNLASEIQQGAQNPDGNFEFQSEEGFTANAVDSAENLRLLVQHLNNKVGALNESIANQYGNGTGRKVGFTGLVAGNKLIEAGQAGAPEGVTVHTNSPKSIRFAKVVHADAVAAANVYNTLQKAYPEILPGGPAVIPALVLEQTASETQTQDTADTSPTTVEPDVVDFTPEQEALAEQSTDALEGNVPNTAPNEALEVTNDAQPSVDEINALINEAQQEAEIEDTNDIVPEQTQEQATDTTAVEESLDTPVSEANEQQPTNTETVAEPDPILFENVHESVAQTFKPKREAGKFAGVEDAVSQVQEVAGTDDFISLYENLKETIGTAVQTSLQTIQMSKKDPSSILEGVGENQALLNNPRFVSMSFVDQNTGEYDADVLNAVMLSVAEWMSTARDAPSKSFNDIITEDLRITMDDIKTPEQFAAIQNGLDIGTVVDEITQLAMDILGVEKDKNATIVQYNGMMEGLVKTTINTMTEQLDTIEYGEVPINIGDRVVTRKVLMFPGLSDIQGNMERTSKGVMKRITGEGVSNFPNIGEKITNTRQTQKRTNLDLSEKELAAIRTMEDTPYVLATGAASFLRAMDKDILFRALGWKDIGSLSETHPLALSILGKNNSIERDYTEALQIVQEIEATGDNTTPAYFPIEVSKVSRHQMVGINLQSNKILRLLVTPTHSELDLNNQDHLDALWVVIGQASGIYKVEKADRQEILDNIQDKFDAEFGPAVQEAQRFLNEGGVLDMSKFPTKLDTQQISAIQTVAEVRNAQARGDTNYTSTISFELDGITNGTANMMVNHGQYLISAKQFENFARVGLFMGDSNATLNSYYGSGNKDIYEVTSESAQANLFSGNQADPKLSALTRLMTQFGDFKVNENGDVEMTRNTAKNPTTKTVYKSGVSGVGSGIAQDFIVELYRGILGNERLVYPDLPGFSMKEDLELALDFQFPAKIDKTSFRFPQTVTKEFSKYMSSTVGTALSEAANEVIGEDIQTVNDMIVLYTQVQADYLKGLFERTLAETVDAKKAAGEIKSKNDLTQKDYDKILKTVQDQAIVFSNGEQNLSIGSVAKSRAPRDGGTKFELSSDLAQNIRQETNMVRPSDAGVQAIPYITIGRGDGMTINNVASNPNGPKNSIFIFDGIDFSVLDYDKHSEAVNQGVWDAWSNNTLQDVMDALVKFTSEADPTLVQESFDAVRNNPFNKSNPIYDVNQVNSIDDISYLMEDFVLRNQARKNVMARIPVAVHQMGGSLNTFNQKGSKGEETLTYSEINRMIFDEYARLSEGATIEAPAGRAPREVFKPISKEVEADALPVITDEVAPNAPADVELSTAQATVAAIIKSTRDKSVRDVVRAIQDQIDPRTQVIMGSLVELNKFREQNFPDDGQVLTKSGSMDTRNNVIYIEGSLTPETQATVIHELIHAATFDKVLSHYEGSTNEAVARLETLMDEFLASDTGTNPAVQQAVAAILVHQAKNDAFSKAAALNEFMAWGLSNQDVKAQLQNTESTGFAKLAKKVLILMKRILGSTPSDIFSGVLFNTQILDGNIPPIDFTNGGDGNNNDGGDNGEITPPAKQNTNFWVDLIRSRLENLRDDLGTKPVSKRTEQYTRYVEASQNAVDKLEIGGFNFDAAQRETFMAIHSVMAMETRLDTQSAAVLNKLFKYVTDNLTPEMFGPVNADQRFGAVMDLFGETKNDENISDAVAVLLALSQTSKGFRNALDQVPTPESTDAPIASLNDALAKTVGFLMGKAVGTIDMNDVSAKESLDALSENIIRQDSDKEFSLLRGLMSGLNTADEFVSGKLGQLSEGAFDVAARAESDGYNKAIQLATKGFAVASTFVSTDRAGTSQTAAKDLFHMGTALDNFVPVREFVSEIVGTDSVNKDVMALLDRTNHAISSARQAYREALPVFLQDTFETHPTAEQWTQMHTVLGKTDFSNLFVLAKPNAAINLLSDNAKLSNAISDSEAVIQNKFNKDVADLIIEKAQQLGAFMVTGVAGTQLLKNAYAINKLTGQFQENMTPEIDRLASLYAIQNTSKEDRDAIVEAYSNDPDAVTNLVVYMQGLNKEEDQKVISETAKLNGYKGYVPDHAASGVRLVVEADSKESELKKQGYVRVADYVASDGYSTIKRGYYFTSVKQGGLYSQGVMQQVRDSYRGVDATTGYTTNGNVTGVIDGDEVGVINAEIEKGNVTNAVDALIPVYDDTGVVSYERAINPDIQRTYLGRRSNLALMLGSWAGRQVEEKFAKQYNRELVDKLFGIYSNRDTGSDSLFVNVAASDLKDPIFRDAWNVIPADTKEYIESVFGEDKFVVRKDMVNLALGYREASVLDIWSGKTRLPKAVQEASQAVTKMVMGNRAIEILGRGEEFTQAAISNIKDLIVVRSLVVPYMNTQANFFQLTSRGVPLKQVLKGYRDKLSEIETYNNNVDRKIELETLIRLNANDKNRVKVLQNQIQTIEDENARMSIAEVIKSGAYKNISEGITDMDVELTSGRIGEWVENQVGRLPTKAQTIVKYGLLSKDTELYKTANKMVQYGDFLAKSIMFDHLVEQKGLDTEKALSEINEEFVNFSFLPGRTRSYLESLGATWFMAFKIRIAKIAMKILRENPVRAMITAGTVGDLGSPVDDNLVSVIAQDRLDYALGWDMLWGAPDLNPWMQAAELVD